MRETKRTGQEGYGMALAGVDRRRALVVGLAALPLVILFLIAVTSTSPYGY